jgi:hypothetical protein
MVCVFNFVGMSFIDLEVGVSKKEMWSLEQGVEFLSPRCRHWNWRLYGFVDKDSPVVILSMIFNVSPGIEGGHKRCF